MRERHPSICVKGRAGVPIDEYALARRAYALPGMFDRLEPIALADVREYAEAGEWECEIDLLIACLRSAP